jgi:ParB family chromosome partitioning protein
MEIPTKDIVENPNNPRTSIESIEDLKASIKAHGLLQPIAVRINSKNKFEVMAGSRRFMACKELGIEKINCTVFHDIEDDKAYEIATAENVVRENMTAVDEANAVAKLFAQGKTRTEIGAMFGKSARWAEGRRRIVELGDKAMEMLAAGKINLGHAEVLAMCKKEDVEKYLSYATWKSPEDLKSYIMNEKPLLERAPFNAKKVCKDCENRSDCQRDLFGDVQNSYCLDRECFEKHIAKHVESLRKRFIKEGMTEVPEDDEYDAMSEYNGFVDTNTEDEENAQFVKECVKNGQKPMFWIDKEYAEFGFVFRKEGYSNNEDDDYTEESEPVVNKDSWSYQISHMPYDRTSKIRNEASAEEKRVVANKLKAVFGNISNTAKAFILEILNQAYTDEEGNEETFLKHQHEAADNFLEGVADAIVNWYDGVNDDIREFLEMESREEFERTANDNIPEDKEDNDSSEEENDD